MHASHQHVHDVNLPNGTGAKTTGESCVTRESEVLALRGLVDIRRDSLGKKGEGTGGGVLARIVFVVVVVVAVGGGEEIGVPYCC